MKFLNSMTFQVFHDLYEPWFLRYISGQLLIVKRCHAWLQIETASIFSPCAHWRTIHGTSECYHELRGRENAINCTNALRSAWFSANSSGPSQRQSAWLGATWTVWESGDVFRKSSLTTGNPSLTSFPSDSRCFFKKKTSTVKPGKGPCRWQMCEEKRPPGSLHETNIGKKIWEFTMRKLTKKIND